MNMIRNAGIIILCWVRSLFRGRARTVRAGTPARILVMPASRLGDMVCATPIFRAIKQRYPECKVIVAGQKNCAAVHEHNADVDGYVIVEEGGIAGNIRRLRDIKVDAAIVTTPSFEAAAAFFLAGVPLVVGPRVVNGYCPYQTKSYRMIMPLFLPVEHRMREYAPREYLKMLAPLGINATDTTKHAGFSEGAGQRMLAALEESGAKPGRDLLVAVSISAGNRIKRWPLDRFAEVASRISRDHGATVVFIGSKADMDETAQAIRMLAPAARSVNMAGRCTLDELKALVSFMDLFISVDTGPIYIAEALDVPTVDITGPIDENEQPPIGPLHKVVHIEDRKGPELFVMNARVYDEKEARRQAEEITVESVISAVEEVIHAINAHS